MKKTGFFDTHIHLDEFLPLANLEKEIRLAREADIHYFLVPGVTRGSWSDILTSSQAIKGIWAAPGIHPMAADTWDATTERALEDMLSLPEVVAIGEIGLDHTPGFPDFDIQEKVFRVQLRLAATHDLPVLIHCRKAWGRTLDILKAEKAGQRGGILHFFSASTEIARQAADMNFAVGIASPVTYPNARRILEVVKTLPEDCLVLETDAPHMSPYPFQQDRNRPFRLPLIAEKVAAIRGWTMSQAMAVTTANALRILKIEEDS